MNLVRLTTDKDEYYEKAMQLYEKSFPPHEQREPVSQKAIMGDEEYHFDLIFDETLFVGIILYWETEDFIYVEHFCIDAELRSRRYGQRALELMNAKADRKMVILEIDPPDDEIAVRRKHFYKRLGYQANRFEHIHPPYHRGNQGHRLVVMTYPDVISETAYQNFDRYLSGRVMDL